MALTNDIRLIGYCGTMPQMSQKEGQKRICRIPVYTNHWVGQHEDGTPKKQTEIHRCVFFGKLAERAGKLLLKGHQVHIRGTMHYHRYQISEKWCLYPQVVVNEFMLSSKAIMTKALYEDIFNEAND